MLNIITLEILVTQDLKVSMTVLYCVCLHVAVPFLMVYHGPGREAYTGRVPEDRSGIYRCVS